MAAAKTTSTATKSTSRPASAKRTTAGKPTPATTSTAKRAAKSNSQRSAAKTSAKKAPAKKAPAKKAPAKKASARTPRASVKKASGRSHAAKNSPPAEGPLISDLPKPRFNKDGIGYTKEFDLHFVKAMLDALQEERVRLTGQAKRLEDEAHQLVEEAEMGDVQFDDEGGEGDTMVVERERDLALSAQAREAVVEIDDALRRIGKGTYGYSVMSGRPIPRERLEAIPWSTVLVEEKVGGIGRR